ncbi:transforming growth factor-beta-induced protein ig-h3-like [Mytilus galloprovincialis]|uniref:transforming growth factor-beta-induced protein ig-h3-like n=1 Tax=Mytilus galloprovincialis TaxID=29158 RepID=UPI0039F021B8
MKILVCFSLCLCTVYGANIIQKATSLGANTLVDLIHKAGLTNTLANGGPFTVFAPSDQAFAAVPQEILQKLQSDKALLQKVLKYHVVSGMHYADEANNELIVPSLVPGLNIRVNIYQGGQVATVEGSKVVLTNQNASNGVIHVLDRVMYPLPDNTLLQYVASQPNLSQLVYSVIRADLQAELAGGPFTLFAPVDSAFDKLPAGFLSDNFLTLDGSRRLLRFHYVKGTFYSSGLKDGMMVPTVEGQNLRIRYTNGHVMVDNARVINPDINVANGVIHIIDTFLQPSNQTTASPHVIG